MKTPRRHIVVTLLIATLFAAAPRSTLAAESGIWHDDEQMRALLTRAMSVDLGELRTLLVGLHVNGDDVDFIEAFHLDGRYFLPARRVFEHMGIEPRIAQGKFLILDTPGGEVSAPLDHLRYINDVMVFSDELLSDVLYVNWRFATNTYSINLDLPWDLSGGAPSRTARTVMQPDYAPPAFGLSQVRLDHHMYRGDVLDADRTELLMRGRMADGIWRVDVEHDEETTILEDYYWFRDMDTWQMLVGNQQVSVHPLLPSMETTGVQLLYDSQPRFLDPWRDVLRTQNVRRIGLPLQTISGVAQPGLVAELRLHDQAIARTRVRLDGTYEFENLTLPSRQFLPLQVYLLDQRSLVVHEIQDFTQTPSDLMLDGGQTLALVGAGVHGNPLDSRDHREGGAAYGLWRYGVSDRVTVEGGTQIADGETYALAGASVGLANRWTGSLSIANREGSQGYLTELFGAGSDWYTSIRSRNYGDSFRGDLTDSGYARELRYERRIRPDLWAGVYGRDVDLGDRNRRFLLPGVTWRFNPRSSLRVWPDSDGDYQADLRMALRERDWLQVRTETRAFSAEYRRQVNERTEWFTGVHDRRQEDVYAETGVYWRPRDYDNRSLVRASVLSSKNAVGFDLAWETALLPGVYSRLEVRDFPNTGGFTAPGLHVYWNLTVDYSVANGRLLPSRNHLSNAMTGALAGRLRLAGSSSLGDYDVERVAITLNGANHVAQVTGDSYFVGNLPPGVYRVALDAEHLPMSLMPQEDAYWVEVGPSATTRVDFSLRPEFGVFGKVTDQNGDPAVGFRVAVYDQDGVPVREGRTDGYGYYRISGLSPGDYRIHVLVPLVDVGGKTEGRALSVEDGDLFDVNFELPYDADDSPLWQSAKVEDAE